MKDVPIETAAISLLGDRHWSRTAMFALQWRDTNRGRKTEQQKDVWMFPVSSFRGISSEPAGVERIEPLSIHLYSFSCLGQGCHQREIDWLSLHSPVVRDPSDSLQNKKCTMHWDCLDALRKLCWKFHIFVSVWGSIHLDGIWWGWGVKLNLLKTSWKWWKCLFFVRVNDLCTAYWISALPGSCQWQIQRWCWDWRLWGSIGSRWEQSLQDFKEPFPTVCYCQLLVLREVYVLLTLHLVTSTGSCVFSALQKCYYVLQSTTLSSTTPYYKDLQSTI